MIAVIDETRDYLIVYKPVGVSMHDAAMHSDNGNQKGMISLLRGERDDQQLFPVHRLDKVTSGLLVVGKGVAATRELSLLFQQRQVEKYYLAILHRKPAKKQGTVMGDMIKARNSAWRLGPSKLSPAITQFFSYGLGDGSRLAIIKPHTGKTHQIRVAMKSVAAPILGDADYGGPVSDRVYLHAWQLKFTFNNEQRHWSVMPGEGERFQENSVRQKIISLAEVETLPWPDVPRQSVR